VSLPRSHGLWPGIDPSFSFLPLFLPSLSSSSLSLSLSLSFYLLFLFPFLFLLLLSSSSFATEELLHQMSVLFNIFLF
jgi:hypothetical protein